MGTKFKANVGTQPNASGLPQVPAGSPKIPQSLLNGVGRTVDKATVRPGAGYLFQQLAGGTTLDLLDNLFTGSVGGYLHPFKVSFAGNTGGKVLVNIAEGHIIGRLNNTIGNYRKDNRWESKSLILPGMDLGWEGGWPNGSAPTPPEDNESKTTDPSKQTNTGDGSSSGTYHSTDYPTGNNGYVSGNAGSVTNPSQGNSGIYHTPVKSGNAGSVTNPNQGNSGTYHTRVNSAPPTTYHTKGPTGGGTYHTPIKSGNAGSL